MAWSNRGYEKAHDLEIPVHKDQPKPGNSVDRENVGSTFQRFNKAFYNFEKSQQ